MKRIALLAAAALFVSTTAFAGSLKGVTMPDTFEVDGKNLVLNGMGLRTKFIVKVYVAGLWLEAKEKDPAKILASEGPRRIQLSLLRDVDGAKIAEAIKEGFEKNSKAEMPKLKDRLDQISAAIPALKEKQTVTFTYVPSKGVQLEAPGKTLTIEGKDFADALFKVWLGQQPADGDLKTGLLGG